jgi:hypothetical protein
MIPLSAPRRKFLGGLCITLGPMMLLVKKLHAQQSQGPPPIDEQDVTKGEHEPPPTASSRKAALDENEKDIKKKVGRLFQLATELKDEVDKTDSAKVLSLGMVKKAEEIERLAKDIKTRAKG